MINKLQSEAFNHSDGTSLVNYNSGTVSKSFKLGTIYNGLKKEEPAFSLLLEHVQGRVTRETSEYFLGWKLNIPFLDLKEKRCSFLNGIGGAFTFVNGDSGDIELTSHKLKNIKITCVESNKYIVTHKDGTIELYNGISINVSSIIDKYGRETRFEFASEDQVSQIYSVDNESNRITFEYNTDHVIVTEHTGDISRPITIAIKSGDRLVLSVSEPGNEAIKTIFTGLHSPLTGFYITLIINPNGSSFGFTYKELKYSDTESVQAIDTLTKSGFDNDQILIYKYSYSQSNYTGYEPGLIQKPGVDNCLYRGDDYIYSVTENALGIVTSYTFNRFHLLVRKYTTKNNNEMIDTTTKYYVTSGDISAQPANYNLEQQEYTLMGNGNDDTLIVIIKDKNYDEYGNLLFEASPCRRVSYEFYQKNSSESDGCPPDPENFFVKNLKKIITENTTVEPSKTDVKEFEYLAIDGLIYNDFTTDVTKKTTLVKRYIENSSVLREYDYHDNSSGGVFLGLIKRITNLNNVGDVLNNIPALPKLDDIVTDYSYSQQSENSRKTKIVETTTTPTNGSKTSYIVIDLGYHLNVVEQADANGNVITTDYDLLDRIIKIDKRNTSSSTLTEIYTYDLNIQDPAFGRKNKITHSQASGRIFEYCYDAYNNLTHVYETIDEWNVLIEKYEYNNLYLIKTTEYDSIFPIISIETNYDHSLFGVSQISRYGGKTEDIRYNFSSFISKQVMHNGQLLSEARFNALDQLISLQVMGVDVESYAYGGFSSEATEINKHLYQGSITNHTDQFDRVSIITARNNSEVESIIEYKYQSPQLSSPCMVMMKGKNDQVIIHQVREHDAFGRVIREGDVNGQQVDWLKEQSFQAPQDEIPELTFFRGLPTKQVLLNRAHNKISQEIIHSNDGTKYKYMYAYNKFGLLTSSEELFSINGDSYTQRSKYSYTYDKRNNLISSVFLVNGNAYNLSQQISSSGRLFFIGNHLGYNQYYSYDSAGRLVTKTYQGIGVVISASYSQRGDLEGLTLTTTGTAGNNILQIISFIYNDLGLITSVSTQVIKNNTIIGSVLNTVKYDQGGNIIEKTITRKDGEDINDSYIYKGSSPSLSNHITSGLTNDYTYFSPEMISTISQGPLNTFEAGYQRDAVSYIMKDGNSNYNFNIEYMNNITNNERDDYFVYDHDNRLISVNPNRCAYYYHYNPSTRISGIYQNSEDLQINYVYLGDHLLGEIYGKQKSLYLTFGDLKIGRVIQNDSKTEFELFGIDQHNTVLMIVENDSNASSVCYYKYTPHGEKQLWD